MNSNQENPEEKVDTKEPIKEVLEIKVVAEEPTKEVEENQQKKRKMNFTPTRARVLNILTNPFIPKDTMERMHKVGQILGNAANEIELLFQNDNVKYDMERFIASLDAIQLAKDTAFNSLTLPYMFSMHE